MVLGNCLALEYFIMRTHLFFIIGMGLFFLSGCQPETDDLKDYYYPVDEFMEGLVYEYVETGDSKQPSHYWLYTTETNNGKLYLSGLFYNESGAIEQMTIEEITATGTTAKKYQLISYDSTGRKHTVDLNIAKNQIYPFGQPDPKAIQRFKISWTDPVETKYSNVLNRGRAFQKFVEYSFNGKQVKCAEFIMVENIEIEEKDAGVQTLETTTKELYAKGIGLVFYQKKIGEQILYTYELKDRIRMIELSKRFKNAVDSNN